MASARRRAVVALSRAIAPGVASGESDVRLSLQKQAGCRPYKATSAAAVGMQPIARPLLEIPVTPRKKQRRKPPLQAPAEVFSAAMAAGPLSPRERERYRRHRVAEMKSAEARRGA